MNILLVGEYSRLHNSLKEGLETKGYNVKIIGTGDGFKSYPVDIDITSRIFNSYFLKRFKNILFKLTSIDLTAVERGIRFLIEMKAIKDIDVLQLINEQPIRCTPFFEKYVLKKAFKKSKKVYLLSCGVDYVSVKYAFDKKFKYSILTPYFKGIQNKNDFRYVLEVLKPKYKRLSKFVRGNVNGIISSDLDYHIPFLNLEPKNYLGLIPNPINIDKIGVSSIEIDSPVIIFHGINKSNYYKKGNFLFDEALDFIENKYGVNKVKILRAESLPYDEYIKIYDSCHILMDQVYSYDQGYNALEAMSKGKVVFTGAEREFLEYYNLNEDEVCINAIPDVDKIIEKLELLILNPEKIKEISTNAIEFIKKRHDYRKVSSIYLEKWNG